MISGNDSRSELRWWGVLISLLCKQFREVSLGALVVIATAWGGTTVHRLGGNDTTFELWVQQRPPGGGSCASSTWYWSTVWAIGCLKTAPPHRKWWKDRYSCLSASITVAASFLLCIYNGGKRSAWTWHWNYTLLHGLSFSRLGKRLSFSLKRYKRDGYPVTSSIPTLCPLPPGNYSTLAPSSPERTPPVWYGASSQGDGNCSAQPQGRPSRSIWICFSVSHELGTFKRFFMLWYDFFLH